MKYKILILMFLLSLGLVNGALNDNGVFFGNFDDVGGQSYSIFGTTGTNEGMDFQAGTDYVSTGLNWAHSGSFSVVADVILDGCADPNCIILANANSGGSSSFYMGYSPSGTHLYVYLGGIGNTIDWTGMSTSTPYKLVYTYNHSTGLGNLTANGVQVDTHTQKWTSNTAYPLSVGKLGDFTGREWDGDINKIGLYDGVVLNSSQISDFNNGIFPDETPVFEAALSSLNDSSGNSNFATGVAGVSLIEGKHNQAFDYDGTDDYIDVGVINGDWKTISLWIKTDSEILTSTAQENPFGEPVGNKVLILGSNTGAIADEIITLRTPSSSNSYYWTTSEVASITADWHLMVFVWTGTTYRLFYDGVDKGTATNRGSPTIMNGMDLNIGYANGGFYNGAVDELYIWEDNKSSTEISDLYNNGCGKFAPLFDQDDCPSLMNGNEFYGALDDAGNTSYDVFGATGTNDEMDFTTDILLLPDVADLETASQKMEIIFTPDSITGAQVLTSHRTSSSTFSGYNLYMDTDDLNLVVDTTCTSTWEVILTAANSMVIGTEYNVTVIAEAGNYTLYIDGVAEASSAYASAPCYASQRRIAGESNGANFNGKIKSYKVWDHSDDSLIYEIDMTSLNDSSGNSNFATGENGVTLLDSSNCKIGQCYDFDGTDDYILDNRVYGTEFTVGFWINFDNDESTGSEKVIGFDGNSFLFERYSTTGKIRTYIDAGDSYSDSLSWNASQWYYVILERNGTTMNYYRNNISIGSGTVGSGSYTNNYYGQILPASALFEGKLDEISTWNRLLTSQEKTELYNDDDGDNFYATTPTPPVTTVTISNYNVTLYVQNGSDSTAWNTNINTSVNITSPTLTISLDTNINTNCTGVIDNEWNYTEASENNSNYIFGTTETTSHVYIFYDSISVGNHYAYVSCIADDGTIKNSGQLNFTYVPESTCIYSGSGNFEITASENCTVQTDYDLGGNNISISGSGNILINSTISNYSHFDIRGINETERCEVVMI